MWICSGAGNNSAWHSRAEMGMPSYGWQACSDLCKIIQTVIFHEPLENWTEKLGPDAFCCKAKAIFVSIQGNKEKKYINFASLPTEVFRPGISSHLYFPPKYVQTIFRLDYSKCIRSAADTCGLPTGWVALFRGGAPEGAPFNNIPLCHLGGFETSHLRKGEHVILRPGGPALLQHSSECGPLTMQEFLKKCKFLGSIPDLWNQTHRPWGPAICG